MRAVQVIVAIMVVLGVLLVINHNNVFADSKKPVLENLLKSQLEGVKNTEIIVKGMRYEHWIKKTKKVLFFSYPYNK